MRHHDIITRWLSAIPDVKQPSQSESKHQAQAHCRKRTLPSPPMSMSTSSREGSPSKRPRLNAPDPDATPTRDSISKSLRLQDSQSDIYEPSTTSSVSQKSGKSSPTKAIDALRNEHVVNLQTFSGRTIPPAALWEVVERIGDYAGGKGVLTPEDAEAIRNTDLDIGVFRHKISRSTDLIDTSGTRQSLGRLPPLQKLVEDIWEEALYCERHTLPEAAWNCAVHFPLLQTALRYAQVNNTDLAARQDFTIRVANVSTIGILRRYTPLTTGLQHNKRVDFCIYLDPQEDSPLEDAIYQRVKSTVHKSINHTELPWLSKSPISLSIETKKTGEDWHAALAQISIWTSAHWSRLRDLSKDAASLPFLPAIIVQGHDWYFVAATQGRVLEGGDRETVIWNKKPIGSTEGIEGIFSIVAVLQYLAQWSAETYWPWFYRAVLGQS